jgi:isoleucyl-tRNA synthetase
MHGIIGRISCRTTRKPICHYYYTCVLVLISFRDVKHIDQQLFDDPIIDDARLVHDMRSMAADIPMLQASREAVQAGLEQARQAKITGSSLQSSVTIFTEDASLRETLERYADELADMFVVSSLAVQAPPSSKDDPSLAGQSHFEQDIIIEGGRRGKAVVSPPQKAKCPRCWKYQAEQEEELCKRCEDVVAAQAS